MEQIFILFGILILITLAVTAAVILKKIQGLQDHHSSDKSLIFLNQNIQQIGERIDKNTEALSSRLDKAAQVIMGVQKELGTVQERFKGFEEFNELLHPKLRGAIGEQILADMLGQMFSNEHYELQFKFKDGQTVDAIIKTRAGIVPIDSKFPLENFKQLSRAENDADRVVAKREFNKAVKRHIDDISKKYILPEEGTMNFAIMYVPSENVYYQIIMEDEVDLLDYAKTKNILMTSPHSFFNFLRVIMIGMERNRLEEQAQKIWDILKGVQQETVKFGEHVGLVGRHLTNAKSAMDNLNTNYEKLSSKIDQVKLLE